MDIATMVIASIALGIAVDDTIHYLTWLNRAWRNNQGSPASIISYSYEMAGSAILKTSLILSLGLMAFLLSDFGPSLRFAVFTSIVLFLAVAGDLLLIPALLGGPFAFLLKPRKKRTGVATENNRPVSGNLSPQ